MTRRHPEVHPTRDAYERDYQHRTTEVWFYRDRLSSLRHVETLTRPEAEALLHQLEVHLYGGADGAGYTRPAAERLRVTLPGAVPPLLRATPDNVTVEEQTRDH